MKLSKRVKTIVLLLFIAVIITNRCDCDDEDDLEVPSEIDVVGTWILKSADFEEEVDLDGSGPMLAMTDIKDYLLGLLNVYATCSSLDEIPIEFSDKVASEATSADPTNKYQVNAVCPEGQGITSQIATYYMDPYSSDAFYLKVEEANDPGNLINLGGPLYFIVEEQSNSGGVRSFRGRSTLLPSNSSHYERFNFVFEEYVED
jgi:hypothetical protein